MSQENETSIEHLLAKRRRLMGPNVSTFYDTPLHLVKGEGVWVWDAEGRKYLDCYNNVPHVGHCNPVVVEAICAQAGLLNTHTRYLHEGILDYLDRLTGTFADGLDTGILACTGSEANDIALRMAQAVTGNTGIIATDHTYHGNTLAVAQLSKTNPPPGGAPANVKFVPAPDSYRPLGGTAGLPHAKAFADVVAEQISHLKQSKYGFAALIICPFFANEGMPELPAGWLDATIKAVWEAGGIVIADEVQPGFGRTGQHMWGHQRIGFVPDIVTLGKPMGNGHPVSAVITGDSTLSAFRNSFRYFNTFGGNPVSCAAAAATLDVIEQDKLMSNADIVGAYIKQGLQRLAEKHPVIGDVRGRGLFLGVEFVSDRDNKTPATQFTSKVMNEMRRRGVLLGKNGVHYNTLKIRPPMPFNQENADLLLSTLDEVLGEVEIC